MTLLAAVVADAVDVVAGEAVVVASGTWPAAAGGAGGGGAVACEVSVPA